MQDEVTYKQENKHMNINGWSYEQINNKVVVEWNISKAIRQHRSVSAGIDASLCVYLNDEMCIQ